MSRVANRFIDPVTGETWDWPINHNDESGHASKTGGQGGLGRNFTVSAPTSLGTRLRQQAANDPLSFDLKGTALTRAQHQTFLYWWKKCESYSIIFRDFSGDEFEVMITQYIPTRKAVVQNRNDMVNAPTWIYDFEIQLDVISVISGDYAGVVV